MGEKLCFSMEFQQYQIMPTPPKTTSSRKQWSEGEMIEVFHLTPIKTRATPLMEEWLSAPMPTFDAIEQRIFDKKLSEVTDRIVGWSEEDLKMKFIAFIVELGDLTSEDGVVTFFDKQISAVVEGIKLTVKSDFMRANGRFGIYRTPYFHFQEYKPYKQPHGDPMAQLLEAFLIAHVKNDNGRPLYGLEVIGKQWSFVVMEGKEYCVSQPFICTERNDLMKIIAMFRLFKHIMKTRLMVD
jgi:hypothetical protein